MKLAYLHPGNQFTEALLQQLHTGLPGHDLLPWIVGQDAPARDIELLIALGAVGTRELAGLDRLGFIQTASTGYESVDIEAATAQGTWVSFSPSGETGNAVSVAEFAILLLLAASTRLGGFLKAQQRSAPNPALTHLSLHGKTVCIVGLGDVGQQLALRLQPFGVRITATDEHPEHAPAGVTAFAADRLAEVLGDADFVVLCVRASKENENLIDAAMLKRMKRGAILVNVARGTLIEEAALMAAVKDGQVAAAGLDVVRDEPLHTGNPLLALPEIVVTPHIAGFTDLMLHGTAQFLVKIVGEVAAGKKPDSVLNAPDTPRLLLR